MAKYWYFFTFSNRNHLFYFETEHKIIFPLNFHCLTYSAMVLVSLMLHFVILFSFCISHLFPHQRWCSNLANSPHNGFHWSTICRVLHTLSSFVPLFFISKSLTRKRDNLDECSTTPPFEHSCAVNKYINATNDSMDHGLRLRFVPDGFCWFWRLVIRNNSNVGSHMR